MEDKIKEIKDYIESLKDDGDVYYLDNKAESLLFDALSIIEKQQKENEQANKKLEIAEYWWNHHGEEHARLFEKVYGVKLPKQEEE